MKPEDLHHMQNVVDLLMTPSLTLNRSRCKWFHNEFSLGGSQINQEKLHTLDLKTQPETE
jgi:hypothetical protein